MEISSTSALNRLIANRFPWICALWLHAAVLVVSVNLVAPKLETARPPSAIAVEFFTQVPGYLPATELQRGTNQSEASSVTGTPLALFSTSESSDGKATAQRQAERRDIPDIDAAQQPKMWVSATTFHANDVLSDPRSNQARTALRTLISHDRKEQICALEAMEQLRRTQQGFRPTRLAPHAFRNSNQKKNAIFVPAGAVRSNRVWYEITYRCQLDVSGTKIERFEFALGSEIDRSLWDEHGLAPIH